MNGSTEPAPLNFIEQLIDADIRAGTWGEPGDGAVVRTRFPPEPNGYLHVGHAKSICLNFGLAEKYGGACNLRFDDTNPIKEEQEYIDSIIRDVRWLGFRWPGARDDDPAAGVLFASDYFEQMYEWAVELIKKGRAYVDDLPPEQIRELRGTLTRPGQNSPHGDRPAEESLDFFDRMRRGEFPDGSRTLRAKIDMAHPNLNMRDPVMYRILHAAHPRTGGAWCIYPMYDWAHGLEDAIEGITHSICTLEFENHRPLYDWFIDAINEGRTEDGSGPWGKKLHHPQQIEFARLELTHTVMSKRKLLELVRGGDVNGWDDPRMPTLSGMRRRGIPPEAIRAFCADVGVAKFKSTIEVVRLENAVRDHLNKTAPRVMAVLNPLPVVITNWPQTPSPWKGEGWGEGETGIPAGSSAGSADGAPSPSVRSLTRRGSDAGEGRGEGETGIPAGSSAGSADGAPSPSVRSLTRRGSDAGEGRGEGETGVDWLDAVNNPEDPAAGMRKVPFSGVIYIERDDFLEDPPKKFFRLAPGREVRLRYAYFITCNEVVKNAAGQIVELRCTYDPATRGGDSPDGRKVKATLHWVSAEHALDAEVRLYDHLFAKPFPEELDEATEHGDEGTIRRAAPPEIEPQASALGERAAAGRSPSPSNGLARRGGEGRGEGAAVDRGPQSSALSGSARVPAAADWKSNLNPDSLQIVRAKIEPSVAGAAPGARYQFERLGYFCVDADSEPGRLVFNRTVSLKDTWAKVAKQ